MATRAATNGQQRLVRKLDNPATLAAATLAALRDRDEYVWVGGERTGPVQRKAQRLIALERPDLYCAAFKTSDGQLVSVWSTDDRTWTGPGKLGRMIGWFGEGPNSRDDEPCGLTPEERARKLARLGII